MSSYGYILHLFTLLCLLAKSDEARTGQNNNGRVVSRICADTRCTSRDNGREICRVPKSEKRVLSHIRLKKLLSKVKCKGNFGIVNNSIWIQNGCKGVFKYCFVPGKVQRPAEKRCENIHCTSLVFRQSVCTIPEKRIILSIQLKKKTSLSKCKGRYGFKNNKIWINGGCRGTFKYCYVHGIPIKSTKSRRKEKTKNKLKCRTMQCTSRDYKRTSCEVGANHIIKNISLTKQKSLVNCSTPDTVKFGFFENKVWVDKGCRALFRYCYTKVPPKKDWLICESENFAYTECPIGWNVIQITQVRTISDAKCVANSTYGLQNGTIWVDQGCRAKFTFLRYVKKTEKEDEIECATKNEKGYAKCTIPPNRRISYVRLKEQYSTVNCNLPNIKYGMTRDNSIWVYQGCKGLFTYRYNDSK